MVTGVEKVVPEGPNSITLPIALVFSGKAGGFVTSAMVIVQSLQRAPGGISTQTPLMGLLSSVTSTVWVVWAEQETFSDASISTTVLAPEKKRGTTINIQITQVSSWQPRSFAIFLLADLFLYVFALV